VNGWHLGWLTHVHGADYLARTTAWASHRVTHQNTRLVPALFRGARAGGCRAEQRARALCTAIVAASRGKFDNLHPSFDRGAAHHRVSGYVHPKHTQHAEAIETKRVLMREFGDSIASSEFDERNERELGHRPYVSKRRLSRFELEWTPNAMSLQADPNDPLDHRDPQSGRQEEVGRLGLDTRPFLDEDTGAAVRAMRTASPMPTQM